MPRTRGSKVALYDGEDEIRHCVRRKFCSRYSFTFASAVRLGVSHALLCGCSAHSARIPSSGLLTHMLPAIGFLRRVTQRLETSLTIISVIVTLYVSMPDSRMMKS